MTDDLSTADVPEMIAVLEQRLSTAWVKRDRPFVEALLAPDWSVIDPSGHLLTRQQVLDETFSATERRIDTMTVDDIKVRVLGPVAAATGRTRATGSYQGKSVAAVLGFTDVFHRRDGRWQVVASQGTMVAEEDIQ